MVNDNFITVGEVVRSYLNTKGEYSFHNYKRFIRIVKENYTDLNIDYELLIDTLKTSVNDLNLVELPAEFIDYLRIGIELSNGEIMELGQNDELSYLTTDDSGAIQVSDRYKDALKLYDYTRVTAPGGMNKGNFKIDPNERMIIFQGDMRNETIVVDYISNKSISTEEALIDRKLLPVLRNYLHWTALTYARKKTGYEMEEAKRNYYRALRTYNEQRNKQTMGEMLDAIRSGQHQGIKL